MCMILKAHVVKIFTSANKAAKDFNCSDMTIKKFAVSGKLFKRGPTMDIIVIS